MTLTINSSITELILEIGNILNDPENNTTTFALEIPNQYFYLEITVKPKQVEVEEVTPYSMNKIKDEQSVFEKDNNFNKQKQKEKRNPIFKKSKTNGYK